jgi:hypothetical protein
MEGAVPDRKGLLRTSKSGLPLTVTSFGNLRERVAPKPFWAEPLKPYLARSAYLLLLLLLL